MISRKVALSLALLLPVLGVQAKGHGGGHTRSYSGPRATRCLFCARNSHGRIKRSREATDAFKRSNPCPSTGRSSGACPGYVIDHVVPLKRGGADAPSNMQWQTKAAAKAKDKVE